MRIAILGGTRFVGRAIAAELIAHGHRVLLIHRGFAAPCQLFPTAAHLHVDRADLVRAADFVRAFGPTAVVDTNAVTAADVTAVAGVFTGCRIVVISSCDVYQAYLAYRHGVVAQCGPVSEASPVRTTRRVFPTAVPGCAAYEKLDVEDAWLASAHSAIVLRSTAVYGPHDYLRRESFVIDRVAAGRLDIPFGPGNLRYTRISAAALATCVRLAVSGDATLSGEVFNVAEIETDTVAGWADAIAAALGARVHLVRVPDHVLPPDLAISAAHQQHLVIASDKVRAALPWRPVPSVARSVRWHARHRPGRIDFALDDRALASAGKEI